MGCIIIGITGSIILIQSSYFIERKYPQLCSVFKLIGVNSLAIFAFQIPFINYATDFACMLFDGENFLLGCVVIVLQTSFPLLGGFFITKIFRKIYPSLF